VKEWSGIFTFPYVFMACTGAALPSQFPVPAETFSANFWLHFQPLPFFQHQEKECVGIPVVSRLDVWTSQGLTYQFGSKCHTRKNWWL
jgi:hypothetical protein